MVLAVSERAWLERLLLDLGPAARVVGPPELQTVGAEAADRLLDAATADVETSACEPDVRPWSRLA